MYKAIKAPLATLSSATHLPTIADVQQYPDLASRNIIFE